MKGPLTILFLAVLAMACANLTTPSGGPKDLKPPFLIKSIPAPNQLNFKGKTVELNFNEYVKLNNPKEEIIISPSPGKNVEIKAKGARVTITPENNWKDSTTYSISFREGIQDITESNIPTNLKLAFSTGPTIDSLSITGVITNLLTGAVADKITVALYSSDTFNIFSHTPTYFTRTGKNGRYKLENIKRGKYGIYTYDDKNKNLKVESRSERYGFLVSLIDLNKPTDSVDIGLISMDARLLKITSIRNSGTITRLRFNKYIVDYSLEPAEKITNAFADNQAEIVIWNPPTIGDSVKLHLIASDSLENKVDTTFFIKKTVTKSTPEPFRWSLGVPSVESETGNFKTTLTFNKPIVTLNFDSIFIKVDTTQIIPITKQDISIGERQKEIKISKTLDKTLFTGEKDPLLLLSTGKGFAYTIDNDTSKAISTSIPILWPEDTGILLIEVVTRQSNYLIQLLTKDGKIIQTVTNVSKYTFKNLPPTEYGIRIIIDANKNGKWDAGNIQNFQEPEKVIFYKGTSGRQSFPIRANWEIGPLIIRF